MSYKVEILKDSISKGYAHRITTFQVTFPRIVLAEFNTHKLFSRNFSSSRAIPVRKMIQTTLDDPFIPVYWGKAQSGMGASVEISPEEQVEAVEAWLSARDSAILHVDRLLELNVAKEIANRVLEPWTWVTGIITATEFENFFTLRRHSSAQPEIRKLADMMYELYEFNIPEVLKKNEWHIPMLHASERDMYSLEDQIKISTGRIARVSYLTHEGIRDQQQDIDLHDKLLISRHLSPFEHVAKNKSDNRFHGNLIGWKPYRKFIAGEFGSDRLSMTKE